MNGTAGKTKYHEAFEFLAAKVSARPKIGVVCGSGLGAFAEGLTDVIRFHYKDIPHFPVSTVAGHKVWKKSGKTGTGKPVL